MKRLLPLMMVFPLAAHAEVMDKEPSFVVVSIAGIVACALSYISARHRPLLLLLVLPLAGIWFSADILETLDPDVGPAIKAEAGLVRVVSPWLAVAGVLACVGLGLFRRYRAFSLLSVDKLKGNAK